jgi:putative ABC transport system permease protein
VSGVAQVQGRDTAGSPVDRPLLVSGRWVSWDGVVLERAFALAMGIHAGDTVSLGGQPVHVDGIAVSAALPPYPQLCTVGCILDRPGWSSAEPGLVWASRAWVTRHATADQPLVWFEFLRLHDPASAPAFAARYSSGGPPAGRADLTAWQDIAGRQAEQLASERTVVVFGSTLLVVLAVATLVVLVGGRMSDEVRRIGALKAVGATPGFVTRLLLTSYVAVGLAAALIGLVAGRLLAPRLVNQSAGLLGHAGGTTVTVTDAVTVIVGTLAIVAAAGVVPAWRAARTSTVRALADPGRTARRAGRLVALSARLPTPALLGLRMFSRRPRRAVLTILAVAVAVCGSVVVLYAQATVGAESGSPGGPADPWASQLHAVTTALTVLLAVMSGVTFVFVSRANAVDARQMVAVARTFGATPAETASGLGVAQLVPATVGLVLGGATGTLLFHALSSSHTVTPPLAQLAGLALLTLVLAVALTALPARVEARRPITETLHTA